MQSCCTLKALRATRPTRVVARAQNEEGFVAKFKQFFEQVRFENWAPRSSRAWRLRQYPSEGSRERLEQDEDAFAASLEERMRRLSEDARSVQQSETPEALGSFTDSDDADINKALASRLSAIKSGDSIDEDLVQSAGVASDLSAPLTAVELIKLVENKYGKRYDLTIARRTFAGKDFVSLNVMWTHLGQRSFPMTAEAFFEKMEGICLYLNAWNRQEQVRTFMLSKPKSTLGLPPRPIVGVAVPLQLDLPPSVIQEWLGDRIG